MKRIEVVGGGCLYSHSFLRGEGFVVNAVVKEDEEKGGVVSQRRGADEGAELEVFGVVKGYWEGGGKSGLEGGRGKNGE